MRTFNLNKSVTLKDFMSNWSLTKLPKNLRLVPQSGYRRNNGIKKYCVVDSNGRFVGNGGNNKRSAFKNALLGLNTSYFYAHMLNGRGDDEKCQYIKSLYN